MVKEEILVVKRNRGSEKLKFKVCDKDVNSWNQPRYQKVIANRDCNLLAYLFYDLKSMGYNVE